MAEISWWEIVPAGSGAVGVVLLLVLFWAAWMSRREGEPRAAWRILLLSPLLAGPFFVGLLVGGIPGIWISGAVLALGVLLVLVVLLPLPGARTRKLGTPKPGVDERDIMFARAALIPGTERFRGYYGRRPENRAPDDAFRREAGLMNPAATHAHPLGFPAADAAFWTIERLRPWVEGHASGAGGASASGGQASQSPGSGVRLGGEASAGGPDAGLPAGPSETTRFLKAWLGKIGAHSVGVTGVRDYHLYTHVGRGEDYGREVELDHPFAIALTVEMDKEMVDRAPFSPTLMESALEYVNAGVMAVQVADLICRLGFRARAHVDGNYRVICPLVARDAGLGELGRMGLLMTPELGPRVRIAVVTTDLPLVPDLPYEDPTTIDFCLRCRKCAEACPSRAISLEPPREDENGVLRWRIDSEACFTLWTRMGTDCARCMAVCPYSHPDNLLHDAVRRGIRRNVLFRRVAIRMDDLVYGRRPPPKELPAWMAFGESGRGGRRMDR